MHSNKGRSLLGERGLIRLRFHRLRRFVAPYWRSPYPDFDESPHRHFGAFSRYRQEDVTLHIVTPPTPFTAHPTSKLVDVHVAKYLPQVVGRVMSPAA